LKAKDALQEVLNKHEEVFNDELGTLKGFTAKMHVSSDATPRFFKPRSVPFEMKTKIDRCQDNKVMEPVRFSDWAAPLVPVVKPDGTVRLCGDYKVTVNKVSSLEQYPIPKMEDMFTSLAGGEKFHKLDMSHAYQQIVLDEDSKKYVTVNMHKGLFTSVSAPVPLSSRALWRRLYKGLPSVSR
jgi:hypothetical protein